MAARPIRVLEVCAGVGGISLGLRLADSRMVSVGYIERDAFAASVLVARMEDATLDPAPIWDDVATFGAASWRGCVDIIAGGIPCQPFSVAGKRRGTDDDRWIWPDVARMVRAIRPRYVFLENTPQFVRHGLPTVAGDLAVLGYDAEWGVFSADEVGVNHVRKRFFLLAADADGLWEHAVPVDAEVGWAPPAGWDAFDVGTGWWTPEPPVRPVDDGTPHRVDQIRCLGNGVVPLVVAHAWRTLRARVES